MPAVQANTSKRFYHVQDLVKIFEIDERTVRRWCAEGKLPEPIRNGKKYVRWPVAVIEEFISKLRS